jgi:predicted double-glycine peptidase
MIVFIKESSETKESSLKLNLKPYQGELGKSWCGPSALKTILNFYGIKKTAQEVATECHTNKREGTSAEQLKAAAEKFGLKAEIKEHCTFEDIREWLQKDTPMIVNWFAGDCGETADNAVPGGHYSVVMGLDADHVYVSDPDVGRIRQITREDFMTVWFDFKNKYIKKPEEMILQRMIIVHK